MDYTGCPIEVRSAPIAVELTILKGYEGRDVAMSSRLFGSDNSGTRNGTLEENLSLMKKPYSVDLGGDVVRGSFRLPLTGESLARVVHDISRFQEKTGNPGFFYVQEWLQAGRTLVLPGKRVIFNPPINESGEYVTQEKDLEDYIHAAKDLEGVRLGDNGFAYVERVESGKMKIDKAIRSRFVRAFEGAREEAKNFEIIARLYSQGVNLSPVIDVSKPTLAVAGLSSSGNLFGRRFEPHCSVSDKGMYGFTYGVFVPKK